MFYEDEDEIIVLLGTGDKQFHILCLEGKVVDKRCNSKRLTNLALLFPA